METKSSDPKHVDISLSQGMTITWADEHQSYYTPEYLRKKCPCAQCRQAHGSPAAQSPFPMYKPAARLTNAETVGRYAIRLLWSDGHSMGIYSFDHLREICPCPECRTKEQT